MGPRRAPLMHLFDIDDVPKTLCPAGRAWSDPCPAVYPSELARVTCPDCLSRFQARQEMPQLEPPRVKRRPDPVYVFLCWAAVGMVALLVGLLWLGAL